jgi:hypothetical protein
MLFFDNFYLLRSVGEYNKNEDKQQQHTKEYKTTTITAIYVGCICIIYTISLLTVSIDWFGVLFLSLNTCVCGAVRV